jgi:hypothetical protein
MVLLVVIDYPGQAAPELKERESASSGINPARALMALDPLYPNFNLSHALPR